MLKKVWAGGLRSGDIVFHWGKMCQVSPIGPEKGVPNGHVPIYFVPWPNATYHYRGPVYTVPLDEIHIPTLEEINNFPKYR